MKNLRSLKSEEFSLIKKILLKTPRFKHFTDQLENISVYEMDDGKMGSLRFFHADKKNRQFEKSLIEVETNDKDGVPIIISINLDNYGDLYELDLWKVNFSPLISFPTDIN